jgi:hypothetical protein
MEILLSALFFIIFIIAIVIAKVKHDKIYSKYKQQEFEIRMNEYLKNK